ncbi:MAG: 4'-phosphopantetheinyl transferase superfamily protein [Ruminococcus sp.]|nr:4'-phosphopantetheinyl transferase superfamily protein [Ruminococcus sp.]
MVFSIGFIEEYGADDFERAYENLSASRKARVDRYKREDDRKRSLLGEILLKNLLNDHFNCDAVLETADNGRPFLKDSSLCVSIAHSDGLVVAVVHDAPVGIDVEKVKEVSLSLIERVCVENEKRFVCGDKSFNKGEKITNTQVLKRFFTVWTGKEAYFKKIGTGITDLKSVDIFTLNREVHFMDDYVIQIVK